MDYIICFLLGIALGAPLPIALTLLTTGRKQKKEPTKEEWKIMM